MVLLLFFLFLNILFINVTCYRLSPRKGVFICKKFLLGHEKGVCAGSKSKVALSLSRNGLEEAEPEVLSNAAILFVLLPLTAELFPYLLSEVTDFSVEPLDRQRYILGLLILKRVFLYSTAITGVDWMAKRSLTDRTTGLGERLAGLNEEMLNFSGSGSGVRPNGNDLENGEVDDSNNIGREFNEQAAALLEQLDNVDGQQQAFGLTILITLSLLVSAGGLQMSKLTTEWMQMQLAQSQSAMEASNLFSISSLSFQGLSLFISILSTVTICAIFSKAEIQRLLHELESFGGKIFGKPIGIRNIASNATFIAFVLSFIAVINPILIELVPVSRYWQGRGFWPIDNVVNILLAVTISRAFQLSSFTYVLTALSALVAYDVFFVYGTTSLTDGGNSIMEAVATAKLHASSPITADVASTISRDSLQSGTDISSNVVRSSLQDFPKYAPEILQKTLAGYWSPGLLQVNLNGRVSDALGLGDIIFPSLLAGWALRYDNRHVVYVDENNADGSFASGRKIRTNRKIYGSVLGGYALGCLLCEVYQTGSGQPALLYVVPAMIGTLIATNFDLFLDVTKRADLFEFDGSDGNDE